MTRNKEKNKGLHAVPEPRNIVDKYAFVFNIMVML